MPADTSSPPPAPPGTHPATPPHPTPPPTPTWDGVWSPALLLPLTGGSSTPTGTCDVTTALGPLRVLRATDSVTGRGLYAVGLMDGLSARQAVRLLEMLGAVPVGAEGAEGTEASRA